MVVSMRLSSVILPTLTAATATERLHLGTLVTSVKPSSPIAS